MAVRSTSVATTSGATPVTPAVPSGASIGDIMIAAVSVDWGSGTVSAPGGWTQLAQNSQTWADSQTSAVFWKRLSAADTGTYSFSFSGGAHDMAATVTCFSGRDTINPPTIGTGTYSAVANASPVSVAAVGVTAVAGDDLHYVVGLDPTGAYDPAFTVPSGYTLGARTSALVWVPLLTATKANSTAGSTGTVSGTFTSSGMQSGYMTWLVRVPAPAATTGNLKVGSTDVIGASIGTTPVVKVLIGSTLVKTLTALVAPLIPSGITAVPGTSGALAIDFTGVSGATNYQLRYRQTGLTAPSLSTQTGALGPLSRLDDSTPGPANTTYTYAWKGTGQVVVAWDWGLRPTHNEFVGRTITGQNLSTGVWNVDSAEHGTGTMAMAIGNTYGVAKDAAGYMLGSIIGDTTTALIAELRDKTIAYLAGKHAPVYMPFDTIDRGPVTASVLDALIAVGAIPIMSAGNAHTNFPSSETTLFDHVIFVGGSDFQDDSEAGYSRYGTAVTIYAPNGDSISASGTSDSATRTAAGTSESAPMVAGQVAKMLEANPALNFYRVREMLISQAQNIVTTPAGSGLPLLTGGTSPTEWSIRDLGLSTSVTHDSLGSGTAWQVQLRAVVGGTPTAWSTVQAATAGV